MNKNQYFECDWRECIASYKFQMRKRWLAEQEQREARLNIYLEALTNALSQEIFIFIAFFICYNIIWIHIHKYVSKHEINGTVMLSVPFIETASIIVIIVAISIDFIIHMFTP